MKKEYLIIIGIVLVFLLIFMLTRKSDTTLITKCSLVSDQSANGYVDTTNYNIEYKDDLVVSIEQIETIDSKDKSILDFFKKQLVNQYKSYDKLYGGYSYSVKEEPDKVIVTINIDYNKLDMEKFIKDNPGMKQYVNEDNKLTYNGVISMYKNIGVVCE